MNIIHHPKCNGSYKRQSVIYGRGSSIEIKDIDVLCECDELPISNDLNIYICNVPKCWGWCGDLDLQKTIIKTLFNKRVYSFRSNNLPKYDGEDYFYQHCFVPKTSASWSYMTQSQLSKISNYFMNDLQKSDELFDGYTLRQLNENYIKDQEFVSKYANPYIVSESDVNKILTKLQNLCH